MNRMPPARAFTLIELIVSVGLFSVVVVVAMSAYLSLIALDRKARATNDVMTNLSFVMESMSRSIRTGTNYNCGGAGNCVFPNGASNLTFVDENCRSVQYRLKTDQTIGECIGSADTSGSCSPSPVTCTDQSATTVTDPRVKVTNLTFYVKGVLPNDGLQPRVFFTISASITPDTLSTPITVSLEGGATQRLIDL